MRTPPTTDPQLLAAIVEAVGTSPHAGELTGRLVIAAKVALHEDRGDLAHQLYDLAEAILGRARAHDGGLYGGISFRPAEHVQVFEVVAPEAA